MKNVTVERVLKVTVHLTAEQWQLYDAPAASAVAYALNRNIMEYVNRGEDRATTERFTLSLMRHGSEFGAFDTEPLRVLNQVLDEIYGVKNEDVS